MAGQQDISERACDRAWTGPMLELDRVSKRYERPAEVVTAIADVSLTVGAAELVTIFGPSGSGKTTLLLLAAGILAPDEGRVLHDDRDLAAMRDREAARHRLRTIGFVAQEPHLMPMTAAENVALPLIGSGMSVHAALRAVEPLMERIGLLGRSGHMPDELSGGERQRIAVARALAAEPKLILADEPTGNLDGRRSEEVLTLLRTLAREQDTAVVLVTHDVRAVAHADRMCTIYDGRLTDVEPAEDFEESLGRTADEPPSAREA